MINPHPKVWFGALFLVLFLSLHGVAQEAVGAQVPKQENTTIPEPTDAEVQVFRDHVTWLASPFLKGRLPGTPEMEIARNYIEYWFKRVGLKPAWGGDSSKNLATGATSYRQPFEFGGRRILASSSLKMDELEAPLVVNKDYKGLAQGTAGSATADVVFIGYGIAKGKDGYQSFNDNDDLTGKIVMYMNFEPMNDAGKSLWRDKGWTLATSSFRKARGLRSKGMAGVIIVIPPGVADDRATLAKFRDRGRRRWGCPAILMSSEAADQLVRASDPQGRDLMTLRKLADQGKVVVNFKSKVTIANEIKRVDQKQAENVGGLIHGKGKLANELIVVGGHIDHLGVGQFGSRAPRERGTIHPGADDNASGAAALIMMADRIGKYYQTLPAGTDARSILFIGFDAEEQGLHGARHYTRAPLIPLDRHALMINFDMIGRIEKHRLRMDGAMTGEGLAALINPIVDASPLDVVQGKSVMMASDHAAFYGAKVPILFSIIDPLHDDYHTPRDTSDKINAVDGARVVKMYTEIVKRVARYNKPIKFQPIRRRPRD